MMPESKNLKNKKTNCVRQTKREGEKERLKNRKRWKTCPGEIEVEWAFQPKIKLGVEFLFSLITLFFYDLSSKRLKPLEKSQHTQNLLSLLLISLENMAGERDQWLRALSHKWKNRNLGTCTHLTVSHKYIHTISIYHTDIDTCITFKHTDTYAHKYTYL